MLLKDVTHTNVGGLKTACISRQELVALISQRVEDWQNDTLEDKTSLVVFDSNGHGISLANTDSTFYDALHQADIIHADGQSVVAMSRWVDGPNIPERSATTDTIHDIPTMHEGQIRHFLLGGTVEVVEKCSKILSEKYKNFVIAGTHHGYFDKNNSEEVIKVINESKAQVLWVGLGKPIEQQWVIDNLSSIQVPVIISCGGCYNYVTGDYARAPQWMQNLGIEWLHRALTEPKKFLWRYITTNPHSIYCVLKHKWKAS